MSPRVLVTDSFCSSNRGDAAILDGILDGLRARIPGVDLAVVSHFPDVARRFHPGVPILDDRDLVGLAGAVRDADVVVSCGGSFLNDIYGLNLHPRLATARLAARNRTPYVVCAQSLGPLDRPLSRTAAREALDGAAWILARDAASARLARDLGVAAPVSLGVDAAVGGELPAPRVPNSVPVLGVTVRDWHFPGEPDAAASQARYEDAVTAACQRWLDATGGVVRFLANCTPLGGYHKDDRAPAHRIAARLDGEVEVQDALALDAAAVRASAGRCDLFLGTRMHSLIFATTAGVPAVGVGYEFKTAEWLEMVGLAGRHVPIEAPDGLDEFLMSAWATREADAEAMQPHLASLRDRWNAQFDALAAFVVDPSQGLPDDAPRRLQGGPVQRGDWTTETFLYDVAHRRLRAVADAVLADGGERVLDLGCSTGQLGRMLGPTYDYTGLDLAPDVAVEEERFRVRTCDLDGDWPIEGTFDVAVCSGSLEYVADLPRTLARMREHLVPGGLAVVTLLNLAHISRARSRRRHPTWRFEQHPDEFVLALLAAGLRPRWMTPSSAGYGTSPPVRSALPTDHDLDGAAQLPPSRMVRLAHQWMVVCEAADPVPGLDTIERRAGAGDLTGALEHAVLLYRALPWSARLRSDIAVLTHAAGDAERARAHLEAAVALDPLAAAPRENLVALGGSVPPGDGVEGAELAFLLGQPDGARTLASELLGHGHVHGARAVAP